MFVCDICSVVVFNWAAGVALGLHLDGLVNAQNGHRSLGRESNHFDLHVGV